MDELTPEQIATNAAQPEQAQVDGQSAKQVPIPDQITAAKFQAHNKTSVKRRPLGGLRFVPVSIAPPQ